MNLFRLFSRPQSSAPAARERLQVLLAHERVSVGGDSDLVAKLRDEILRVISKHMKIDDDKVSVKMERGANVSTLEVDIEIPFDAAKKINAANKADAAKKPEAGKKAAA
jgi:cell division topological specificity factor